VSTRRDRSVVVYHSYYYYMHYNN